MSQSKEERQKSAEQRKLEHESLTIQQRISKLDNRFGAGLGATKERAKLQRLFEESRRTPKTEAPSNETVLKTEEESSSTPKPKRRRRRRRTPQPAAE